MRLLIKNGAYDNITIGKWHFLRHVYECFCKENTSDWDAHYNNKNIYPDEIKKYKDNFELAKILVENGANLGAVDGLTSIFLGRALLRGCYEVIIKLLIEKRVNLNGVTVYASSLMLNGCTPLFAAADKGCNIEIIKSLVDQGADVYATDKYKKTVLHAACYGGNVETVNFLIKGGADCNVVCSYGRTPLDIMKKNPKFKELVDTLPFLDRNPRLIRNTIASLLVLGSMGACYYVYNKIFNG
jgi:ankyrin repeat protein